MAEVAKKGLEGIVVAESKTSLVNGAEGKLVYDGYAIETLAENALFEEVAFLLWNERLPNRAELENLRSAIATEAALPEAFLEQLKQYPLKADPMAMLRTAVSALAMYDADSEDNSVESNRRKAIRLTGQITTICAAWDRIRNGKAPIAPRKDLNLAQNFVYMLTGEEPDVTASEAINVYLVLLAEHGMNASTFASRVTVATGSDMHSGVVSGIGTLKGPSHGGANAEAMHMFLEIGDPANVEGWFKTNIKEGDRRIMGIGHRIYKALDPRAAILEEKAKALAESSGNEKWFQIAKKLAEAARADQYFIERKLYPNVDYYSAIVLYTIHLDVDMFTPLFAMARVVGWTAHIMEQFANNRLIRPDVNYVGPMGLQWVPIDQR
ncbi:MAG: citrate synthase [Anaerolineae bacterium]|nr:citrate synthase [Anaerolineae bacterium]MBN8619541.1 citrate synthase [Anaerolineae bacterium]